MRALALSLLLLAPLACRKPSAGAPASWTASRGGRVVLRFSKGPGLPAAAPLPRGAGSPPERPFVNVSAVDPAAADDLRGVLDRSRSLEQFVENLRSAGYDVARDSATR